MRGKLKIKNFIGKGTIARNTTRLSYRQSQVLQRRLHTSETTTTTAPIKTWTKWSILKNSAKLGLVAGIAYGCYGKLIMLNRSWVCAK